MYIYARKFVLVKEVCKWPLKNIYQDIAENSGLSTNQVKELRRAFIYKGNSMKKDTSIAPH